MRPVSEAFLRTLRGSHRVVVDARICTTFQTGTNPVGTTIPVVSGDVQLDGTADIRSTLDLTVSGEWPSSPSDDLAPYGNEVFIRRGISYGGGAVEWCPLGYFRIVTPEQQTFRGPIRISGQDRMAGIIDARLTAPVQYSATTTAGTVVSDLVTQVYPGASIEWDDDTSGRQLGRALVSQDDRYGFLNDLITSYGKIWYWDHRGVLVITNVPDTTTPVWTVDSGRGGVLVSLSRSLTRTGIYNGVVATGEATDTSTPPTALAVDDNPSSPTYWHGKFGPVPMFYSSPLLTTAGQCAAAARTLLTKQLGAPYSVSFTAAPNPALEPWDVVQLRYPGRSELHVLKTVTVPLTADAAVQCATREQATPIIGIT